MNKYIASIYDISDWEVWSHLQTGGSRNKKIVKNPEDQKPYYFKTSLLKGERYYKYEFWSEIIVSKLGSYLGFNLLDYNIGITDNTIGCISKSMLSDLEQHELIEGRQYLAGTNGLYDPNDKKCYKMYTFQFIEKALKTYNIPYIMDGLLKAIVFDCIIGNSDRHQDNWSIICFKINHPLMSRDDSNIIRKNLNARISTIFEKVKLILKLLFTKKCKIRHYNMIMKKIKGEFAPIYDSGCCLVREYEDDALDNLDIDKYIARGVSEIRWEARDNKKVPHFELLKLIKEYDRRYSRIVNQEIKRVLKIYNKEEVKNIVYNIDQNLDKEVFRDYILPDNRKKIICEIIDRRIEKMKSI